MNTPMDDEDTGMPPGPDGSGQERVTRMSLSNEAAEWFVRLRDDRMGERHRERNVRWIKQSPAHIAELLRIQQVYQVLRAAKVQGHSQRAPDQKTSNVIELDDQRPARSSESLEIELKDVAPSRSRRRLRFEPWKLAAAVACLMVAFMLGFMAKVAWLDRAIETGLGEWRTVLLKDGSKVRVGPDSRLRVSFGDDHRTIHLIRGEAMFAVAKDPTRPFYVESEMVGVLAVGTEFRVSRLGGKDVVAVTEGSVALYRDGRDAMRGAVPSAPSQFAVATGGVALAAGEQVSVTPSSRSKPVAKEKVNVEYEQAWGDGWLVYENKTVGEVASAFNRFNRVQIVVADETIASRRLKFFRGSATDPESFVTTLSASPDVSVVRDDPNVLRIERRHPTAEISTSGQAIDPNAEASPSVDPDPI